MAHTPHTTSDHGHDGVHISSVGTYIAVFLALMVLTVITVWAAFIDFGVFSNIIAMAIAVTKATLVVMIFMHVKYSTRLIKLTVVSGFSWLIILFAYTMADYLTRSWDATALPWS